MNTYHGVYTCSVYMECIHGVNTWSVYMECIHGVYTCSVYMECKHGVYTWSVYMECIIHVAYKDCSPALSESLVGNSALATITPVCIYFILLLE